MFIDPADQYQFELPLGWAYDPEHSHLISVMFRRWERPDEVVSVRAMPTFAPADARLEGWYKALEERCFPPRMRPFTQIQCGSLPAALAEMHETETETVHRRILVVRGTRLDIIAEHRAPEPSTGPSLSAVLSAICMSLDVPTNRFLPTFVKQDEVESYLHQAQGAIRRQAWHDVLDPALRVHRAARATYLHSVVENTPLPEIPAISAVIDALTFIAQATGSLYHLRDAEHLALRALYTLHHLPFLSSRRRRRMDEELVNQLKGITDLQVTIAQNEITGSYSPSPGFGLSLLRVDPVLGEARQLANTGQHSLALLSYEIAIADLLTALIAPISAERLPQEMVRKLMATGAKTPEELAELAKQIFQRSQLPTLQRAVSQLSLLRSLSSDVVGAAEAGEFLVTIARTLVRTGEPTTEGRIMPPEDQPLHMANALIVQATNLAHIEDEPSLEEAHKILDEAEELLDKTSEEGALRASLCLVRASLLHSQRRVDGALEIIDRGLRAAAAEPEATEDSVRELKTIKSQFLIHLGRLQEARELASEVIASPEGESPHGRLRHASYYLNLAIIDSRLNNPEEAAKSLREALRRALAVAPFGEETFRILMVASRLFFERAPRLSEQLNLAAAATLDAHRATIVSDKFRIGFDESSRHREVYEDLVGRLVAFGSGKEAVAAADRSRARSLNELLITSKNQSTAMSRSMTLFDEKSGIEYSSGNPPSLQGDNVEKALREGAEYITMFADARLQLRGGSMPLRANEIESLMQEIRAPALLIQPVRQQVALLLVRPSGEVEARFSPLSRGELLELVDVVQSQLRIHSIPRGESGNAYSSSRIEDLNEALTGLWRGLIGPVNDLLMDGNPLVIVPYREFTLVPFAILRDPNGCPLVESYAISVSPSLATLRTLRQRGPWTRTRPGIAYVVGDPAFDPTKYLGGRLRAARDEAKAIADSLKGAGVDEENICLRLNDEAHEESYRREARGCDLVHLACHAKLDEPAYTSFLCLAPYEHYDGLLLAPEVADVKLNDALVFLGACETGQGRAAADGIIGLGRAFLEANARAVILSLWKVQDDATAALSGHFYRAFLDPENPLHVAEALREAMLATRADLEAGRILLNGKEPLEPHPTYWAPFIVLGDALSIQYKGGR